MTRIDDLARRAGADLDEAIRHRPIPPIAEVVRRGRRRTAVALTTAVVVAGVTVGTLLTGAPGLVIEPSPADSAPPAERPSSTPTATTDGNGLADACRGAAPAQGWDRAQPVGWRVPAQPPESTVGGALVAVDDRLVTLRGMTASVFDPSTESWTCLPPAQFPDARERTCTARMRARNACPRQEPAVFVGIDGLSLVIRVTADQTAIVDLETQTWREGAPMPPAAADAIHAPRADAAVWTGTELLLFIGSPPGSRSTAAAPEEPAGPLAGYAYDPALDRWRTLPPAPVAINDVDAVWTGRLAVVTGAYLGSAGNRAQTSTAVAVAYDPASDRWRDIPDPNLSPQSSDSNHVGGRVLVVDYRQHAALFDPSTGMWQPLGTTPIDAAEASPVLTGDGGGPLALLNTYGQMAVFDARGLLWRSVASPVADDNASVNEGVTLAGEHDHRGSAAYTSTFVSGDFDITGVIRFDIRALYRAGTPFDGRATNARPDLPDDWQVWNVPGASVGRPSRSWVAQHAFLNPDFTKPSETLTVATTIPRHDSDATCAPVPAGLIEVLRPDDAMITFHRTSSADADFVEGAVPRLPATGAAFADCAANADEVEDHRFTIASRDGERTHDVYVVLGGEVSDERRAETLAVINSFRSFPLAAPN